MVLANKAIPMTVSPELRSEMPQVAVLLFQCAVAVVLVELARLFGYAEYQTFQWSLAKQWLPVNIFFIAMLVTGFLSLVHASVPMVTIFKNLTNLITVSGDWYLYNEEVSNLTIIAVLIMTAGAILAGMNDLEFSWAGYFWMIMNCLSTSGYVLYTKYATGNIKLSKMGMLYYNNLLSTILLIPICLYLGEWGKATNPAILTPAYIISNALAGFLGTFLAFPLYIALLHLFLNINTPYLLLTYLPSSYLFML
jgi:GDP-mannose transporter